MFTDPLFYLRMWYDVLKSLLLCFQKLRVWWKKTGSWKKQKPAKSAWTKTLMLYFCHVDICLVAITVHRHCETVLYVVHSFAELCEYFWPSPLLLYLHYSLCLVCGVSYVYHKKCYSFCKVITSVSLLVPILWWLRHGICVCLCVCLWVDVWVCIVSTIKRKPLIGMTWNLAW